KNGTWDCGRCAQLHRARVESASENFDRSGDERKNVAAYRHTTERGHAQRSWRAIHRPGGRIAFVRLRRDRPFVAGGESGGTRGGIAWLKCTPRVICHVRIRPMKSVDSRWIKGLFTFRPEPEQQARRIVNMQLHVVLPAKAGIIAVVLYYVFTSDWSQEFASEHNLALDLLRKYFVIYCVCNIGIGVLFLNWRRFAPGVFQWLVFILGLLDGLFVSGLVL